MLDNLKRNYRKYKKVEVLLILPLSLNIVLILGSMTKLSPIQVKNP